MDRDASKGARSQNLIDDVPVAARPRSNPQQFDLAPAVGSIDWKRPIFVSPIAARRVDVGTAEFGMPLDQEPQLVFSRVAER